MGPYANFHDKQAVPSVITHARLVYTSRAIPANILLALEKNTAQTLRIIHFWNRRLWRKVYKRPKRNKKPKLKFCVYSSQLIKAYWMMRRAYYSWRHGWVRGYIATNRDSAYNALSSSRSKHISQHPSPHNPPIKWTTKTGQVQELMQRQGPRLSDPIREMVGQTMLDV